MCQGNAVIRSNAKEVMLTMKYKHVRNGRHASTILTYASHVVTPEGSSKTAFGLAPYGKHDICRLSLDNISKLPLQEQSWSRC